MDSIDASNEAASTLVFMDVVFMDASLLSWIPLLTGDVDVNAISPRECAKAWPGHNLYTHVSPGRLAGRPPRFVFLTDMYGPAK
jgi:hypothetical protein